MSRFGLAGAVELCDRPVLYAFINQFSWRVSENLKQKKYGLH